MISSITSGHGHDINTTNLPRHSARSPPHQASAAVPRTLGKLRRHKRSPQTRWHHQRVRHGHAKPPRRPYTTASSITYTTTCTLPMPPETATHDRPWLPTRPSHPAGRASTGWPLLDAHSGSVSDLRMVYHSTTSCDCGQQQAQTRESVCAARSERTNLRRTLVEFVRDQRRSPCCRRACASTC